MGSTKKPITKKPREHPRPVSGKPQEPRRWTFSFQFFQQRESFGLQDCKPAWFSSFLARLTHLSKERVDDWKIGGGNWQLHGALRCHPINWAAPSIPLKLEDLGLPPDYRDQENYPTLQFQLSTGCGRVAGFFDENDVFNVVLLDPEHNLQPSKDTGYRVTTCRPAESEHELLLAEIKRIRLESQCKDAAAAGCPLHSAFLAMEHRWAGTLAAILVSLDPEYAKELDRLFAERKVESMTKLIEMGVLHCSTK